MEQVIVPELYILFSIQSLWNLACSLHLQHMSMQFSPFVSLCSLPEARDSHTQPLGLEGLDYISGYN